MIPVFHYLFIYDNGEACVSMIQLGTRLINGHPKHVTGMLGTSLLVCAIESIKYHLQEHQIN